MVRNFLLLLILVATCLSSACTHYYYAPNTLQTPFLQEQHDTRISLGNAIGHQFSGLEAHAVYSPLKYGAVMLNHFQVQHRNNPNSSDDDWGKGRLTEIGLGVYYPVGKVLSLSLFGGWGAGRVLNVFEENAQADMYFERRFLQPGLVIQGKWARFGTAVRFNQLEYIRGEIDFEIGEPHVSTIESIENASPLYIPEFNISFGFGRAPFWLNFISNTNLLHNHSTYGFASSTFVLAVQFDLNYFWQQKEELKQH